MPRLRASGAGARTTSAAAFITGGSGLTNQGMAQLREDSADVVLACQGDPEAFERLYRMTVGRIRGLARRMAGFDAADELTQDIFVRAWEKLGTFRGESQFGTWLYRLAVNVIVERRRSAARRSWLESDDGEAVYRVAGTPATDGAAAIDLEAAVERLPEGARQVFVLHDVEGYKHQEIGKMLGIAVGTSKGQLHRARMILRHHLGGRPRRDEFFAPARMPAPGARPSQRHAADGQPATDPEACG